MAANEVSGLMSIERAKQIIWQTILPLSETLVCPVGNALDRILAHDIISPINVPGYDNSAMDGYAFRYADLKLSTRFSLVGVSAAGNGFDQTIGRGECVRIMTGAQIPMGADTVVMQENTKKYDDQVDIIETVKKGEAIRLAGDDISKGAVVLSKGKRISAIDIGLMASLGLEQVSVFRKVKVAVFSTGDELLAPGEEPQKGRIFDSNRPMLLTMLTRLGAEPIDMGIIPDDRALISEAVDYADKHADCVITCGGVSVGDTDFTREVLTQKGEIDFWKLAMKPGKPLAFGRLKSSIFFGLPGNPVSAAVTFEQVAAPSLLLLAGCMPQRFMSVLAVAKSRFRKRPGRTDFQRAFCYQDETGTLCVESAGKQSSGVLSCFSKSNCYAVLEKDRAHVETGEKVTVQFFDRVMV